MADRVKYLLLGLLFLVVAGVIAYDRWNPAGEDLIEARGVNPDQTRIQINDPEAYPEPADDPRTGPPAPAPLPETRRERLEVDPAPAPVPLDRELQPAPPPAPLALPPVEPTPGPAAGAGRTHVVQSGETLERIAMEYYGTIRGVSWIMEANALENANRIFAKQKLVIPARNDGGSTPRPVARASQRPDLDTPIPPTYVVRQDDGDLYAICRRFYGSAGLPARVNQVMSLNGLWSKDVTVGARVQLPPR